MKHLIAIFITILSCQVFAQSEADYRRTVNYSILLEELKSDGNKPVTYRNTYFKMDRDVKWTENGVELSGVDKDFYEMAYDENGGLKGIKPVLLSFSGSKRLLFIDCYFEEVGMNDCSFESLEIIDCVFDGWWSFWELKSNDYVLVDGCEFKNDRLDFGDCDFAEGLSLMNTNLAGANSESLVLEFKNNNFKSFNLSGNFKSVVLKGNNFYGESLIEKTRVVDVFEILNDTFVVDTSHFFRSTNPTDGGLKATSFNLDECEIDELSIHNNVFIYNVNEELALSTYTYALENSVFDELIMKEEAIARFSLNNTVINNRLNFERVTIYTDFSAQDVNLPEYNIDFDWSVLSGKLNFLLSDSSNYNASDTAQLADVKNYNSFITTYKKFFSVYKNKGDLKSANACYREMKDVETRRLRYVYKTQGGIDNWLNYQLNNFLKFFADYGTSPIKSVKISGWVIIIFAFFYFFFYSDWDRINRRYLVRRGDSLINYFRSEQKLEDIYSEKHKEDLQTFTQFKVSLKESRTEVPFFFMVFLKPLYWIAVLKHKGNKFLYKRVEFLQGRWVDLTAGKKLFLGLFTFLAILVYGIYLVVVRSLNSLILSINTFTTLGFGDIPVVGISRYVAILEGFLGWFLLSIFSVSLISQILQN